MGDDPAARAYRLRGPECSLVVMTVRSPGEEERSVAAVRARVQGNVAIHAALVPVDDGRRVAYILIPTFFDMTIDDQVRDALEEFGPLDGLIIDLRPNGGGSSVVAEPIMSLFVGGTVGDYLSGPSRSRRTRCTTATPSRWRYSWGSTRRVTGKSSPGFSVPATDPS
jgi:C-terminal processing protease CtpA/Prc